MKSTRIAALAASAILGWTTYSQAAIVTYGSYIATSASDTSWVLPTGYTSVAAINFGGDETTFGGVTWADGTDTAGSIVTGNDNVNGYGFRYGVPNVNWGTNNAVFFSGGPDLLNAAAWQDASNAPNAQLQIGGLTVGAHYAIQFVVADNRGEYVGRTVTLNSVYNVSGNSNSIQYAYGDGRFAVVTADFVADATAVAFNPLATGGGQINGVHIMVVPEPGAALLGGLGLLALMRRRR